MLCPEVWKFTTNKNTTSYQKGNYDAKAKKALKNKIKNNFFNQMVSVVLPECETIPIPVQELIKTADYYLVRNLSLCELVRKDFVEAFIKRGRLTGLSLGTGTCDDFENKIFVTPDGKLKIVISKDLYQILGVEGSPVGQSKERFEITIGLKNNNFLEHPKLYNNIKNALSRPEIEQFDFKLTWESSIDQSTICPSSIAKFFKDSGYKVEQHSQQTQLIRTNNVKIPTEVFSGNNCDLVTAHQVVEYFAYVMLDCDMNSTKSEELNSYRPDFNLNFDPDTDRLRNSMILHCKGLMSSDFVVHLLETLETSDDCKYVIMNIDGEQLPGKGSTGHAFVLLNDKKYFCFTT